jgi:hypothetical protein
MRRVDAVHLALMCTAAAFAYLVPFELLLLSYVVLGPAHYLTEISWLHDRKFFLPHRGIALVLVAVALGAAFIENGTLFGVVIWLAFVVCALFAATTTAAEGVILVIVATGLTAAMAEGGTHFVILGTLLPTLIHVSVFTLVFMVLGAARSGSKPQMALVAIYLATIALILVVPPSAATVIPKFGALAHDYFGGVAPALGRVLGLSDLTLDARITGLLAFVYTYHYLNWFIKADVIRWADIPRSRLAFVIAFSAASTGLYFYDYLLGFSVLLGLSLLHVILEFPLNSMAVRQLGTIAGRRLVQGSQRA